MPKASWNIKDFSGGFNSFIDKRDIEDNQSSVINNLIAPNKGVLKLAGGFIRPAQFNNNEGGFGETGTNVNTGFYLQPSAHFIRYSKGLASTSGSSTTVTITDSGHGLTTNTIITIIKATGEHGSTIVGNQYAVTRTAWNTFTLTLSAAKDISTAESVYYAVGANYVDLGTFSPDSIKAYDNYNFNQLILKANSENQFGFYNVNGGYFVGSNRQDFEADLYTDRWFFDTQYLWNFNQYKSDHPEWSRPEDYIQEYTLNDGYYIDGVFRVLEESPKYWQFGYLRRPVGLYYIEKHSKFNAMTYYSGWYPLRTHCLSPAQYQKGQSFSEEDFNGVAGKIQTSSQGTVATLANAVDNPTSAHQINIGVDMGQTDGTWDLASGSKYNKIGLGISFLYDSVKWQDKLSASQESNITRLTTDGTATGSNLITIGSGANSKSLSLAWKVHKGETITSGMNSQLFEGNTGAIAENRGSQNNNGNSNIDAWNPRIVGAKIYIIENNVEVLEDPLYLATINFYGEESKHGISEDHNFQSSTSWTQNTSDSNIYYQGILDIEDPPILSYFGWHNYNHNEQINVWYKTSAIVNRKLYAGNVSYFTETNPLDITTSDKKIANFPDKILVSPENQFDVLPTDVGIQIAKNDGQDIIRLESFNNDLLIFKSNDLFVLDCSQPDQDPILKYTFYGNGILEKDHITKSPLGIFSVNKNGLFYYDGEKNTNLLTGKIDADYWETKVFNEQCNILYDPQYNLVLINTNYNPSLNSFSSGINNLLIYNLNTQAFFYKSEISNEEVGFLSNGLNIDGRLYSTTGLLGTPTESFSSSVATVYVPGEKAMCSATISTTNTGTFPLFGGTCPAGALSTDVAHLKVKRSSDNKWVSLNPAPFFGGNIGNEAENLASLSNQINSMGALPSNADDEYWYLSYIQAADPNKMTIMVYARNKGPAYNFVTEDLTSINSNYGTTAIAFANDTTENTNPSTANISYGNLDSFTAGSINNGVNRVPGVFDIQVDRDGARATEVQYIIEFKYRYGNGSIQTLTYKYTIGYNYFVNDPNYIYVEETTGSVNTDNDALIQNIHRALSHGLIKAEENDQPITNYFTISILSGSSGSKKFQLTMSGSQHYTLAEIHTSINNIREGYTGTLLQWYNVLPKDDNGASLMYNSQIHLETKDIDFNEPGIRKKIYKAYITYTKGDGNIKCYYQANQSGTWTAADVKNASTANQLNDSATQTQAELSFGTGGNNIYSFALKFESAGIVTEFEINDISLIYRLKRAK